MKTKRKRKQKEKKERTKRKKEDDKKNATTAIPYVSLDSNLTMFFPVSISNEYKEELEQEATTFLRSVITKSTEVGTTASPESMKEC